jgi:hypothetical protein
VVRGLRFVAFGCEIFELTKARLENRYTLTGIVGSNPTASAKCINGLVLDLG